MCQGILGAARNNRRLVLEGDLMEEMVFFRSGELEIEGLLEVNSRDRGVVITHPHPLYGGDMYNPVVEAIENSYKSKGYTTLRFNFRGVGRSGGNYGNGAGEQEDVASALSFLREIGTSRIDLAGYSFGAYVNAGAVWRGASTERMIMVSPPVALMDFGVSLPLPVLALVVTGSRDDIAPAGLIDKMLPQWNPDAELEVIEGADHFYSGCLADFESLLSLNI